MANSDAEFREGLPASARVYEREYEYWPWGEVLSQVSKMVADGARRGARVLDYMCGTGYLLHRIKTLRPDLECAGCSLMPEFIAYGQQQYPEISLHLCDAFHYVPEAPCDVVLCTAGIHHLPWLKQRPFVAKVAAEMVLGGTFIVADEMVSDWFDERSRRAAVLAMHTRLLNYVVERDAPVEVLTAVSDVLRADLSMNEFKFSERHLTEYTADLFELEGRVRVWPTEDGIDYGDMIFVYSKKK